MNCVYESGSSPVVLRCAHHVAVGEVGAGLDKVVLGMGAPARHVGEIDLHIPPSPLLPIPLPNRSDVASSSRRRLYVSTPVRIAGVAAPSTLERSYNRVTVSDNVTRIPLAPRLPRRRRIRPTGHRSCEGGNLGNVADVLGGWAAAHG